MQKKDLHINLLGFFCKTFDNKIIIIHILHFVKNLLFIT